MADCRGACVEVGPPNSPVRPQTPPLPEGCQPLSTQVAGHIHGGGKAGFLESSDGTVLKPISSRASGRRELRFYEEVFREDQVDPVITGLRCFLPRYRGLIPEKEASISYMKLDDVTRRFKKPCIMDIKIGRRTCLPDSSERKKMSSLYKHPHLPKLGFQILGMKIYHPSRGEYVNFDSKYGRELNEDESVQGLVRFFSNRKRFRRDLLPAFLKRLERIENWFDKQNKYHFVSSSLLFVYEGDMSDAATCDSSSTFNNSTSDVILDVLNGHVIGANSDDSSAELGIGNGVDADHDPQTIKKHVTTQRSLSLESKHTEEAIDIRMIDFPHAVPSTSTDDDYLYGLRRLITSLKSLLNLGTHYHQLLYLD
ncbi:inositol polyphosphate multikinase-like [Glandiceps talaboti]